MSGYAPVGLAGFLLRNLDSEDVFSELIDLGTVGEAELLCECLVVADLNDSLVRILAEEVGRERLSNLHGLSMAGRHPDHEPLGLAVDDIIKGIGYEDMMSAGLPLATMDVHTILEVAPAEPSLFKLALRQDRKISDHLDVTHW